MSSEILEPLDLSNFEVYVECIKGKWTDIRKLGVKRTKDILELIHTEICGPFPTPSWNGQQYFISFIDDYSRLPIFNTWEVSIPIHFKEFQGWNWTSTWKEN